MTNLDEADDVALLLVVGLLLASFIALVWIAT